MLVLDCVLAGLTRRRGVDLPHARVGRSAVAELDVEFGEPVRAGGSDDQGRVPAVLT